MGLIQRTTNRFLKRAIKPVAASYADALNRYNAWREDNYNPLRSLTIQQAISYLDDYNLGRMADLQWLYARIEQTDPDLIALIERRTSAILEMDYDAKMMPETRRGRDWDETLAAEQQAALREGYARIDNLYEAIEHLAMASFRGFAHVEMQTLTSARVSHLEVVDQWNLLRNGYRGDWKYNPTAQATNFQSLTNVEPLPMDQFLYRQVARHIDRIALIKYIRMTMAEKDWTAFIEIYGIPSGVVIMPQNVPTDKETEYRDAAKEISEGGSGALPNGSEYKPNDAPRGVNPFRGYLDYLTEKLILAGTGGMLTMLTQSGSGTLAGGAHSDTFRAIAKGEARKISEILQRQLDREILFDDFNGQPVLAYTELAFNQETDTKEVVEQAAKLSQAGYLIETDELSEITGYDLTLKAPAPSPFTAPPGTPGVPPATGAEADTEDLVKNRDTAPATPEQAAAALADTMAAVHKRVNAIAKIEDEATRRDLMQKLLADLPAIQDAMTADPSFGNFVKGILTNSMMKQLKKA